MPNDAKLGLVVGVGLVIVLAVVYCRKEDGIPGPPPSESYARPAPAATPPALPLSNQRPLVLKSTAHVPEETPGRTTALEGNGDAPTEAIPEAETDEPEYRPPGRPRP
jgi:hypothetical protein